MIHGVVYLIQNMVNGKRYVGQTTKPLDARIAQHMHGGIVVDKAIQKYGIENFRYGVIKTCASAEELNYWEKYFIAALKSKAPYGYNMTDGGDGVPGLKRTPEQCAKISAGNKGKKRSPEAIAKTAAANTGKKRTPEQCARISTALTGKKKSPEHCANIAATQRGKKRGARPPEVKAKISAKNTGKKRTPEQRARMSAAKQGKKQSPEQRTKILTARHKKSPFKNLVAELATRQMSYKALSELMGKEQSYISRRMCGRQEFTDYDKKKLAEIFGKSAEYLLQRFE